MRPPETGLNYSPVQHFARERFLLAALFGALDHPTPVAF
jgi:hypothetical protein